MSIERPKDRMGGRWFDLRRIHGFCPSCQNPELYLDATGCIRCAFPDCEEPESAQALLFPWGRDSEPKHRPGESEVYRVELTSPPDRIVEALEHVANMTAGTGGERTAIDRKIIHDLIGALETANAVTPFDGTPTVEPSPQEPDEERIRRIVRDELVRVRAAEIRRRAEQDEEDFRATIARQNVAAEAEL